MCELQVLQAQPMEPDVRRPLPGGRGSPRGGRYAEGESGAAIRRIGVCPTNDNSSMAKS